MWYEKEGDFAKTVLIEGMAKKVDVAILSAVCYMHWCPEGVKSTDAFMSFFFLMLQWTAEAE